MIYQLDVAYCVVCAENVSLHYHKEGLLGTSFACSTIAKRALVTVRAIEIRKTATFAKLDLVNKNPQKM